MNKLEKGPPPSKPLEIKHNSNYTSYKLREKADYYLGQFYFAVTPTKRTRIIATLVAASRDGIKITRFDVEVMGDHCLNTTIAQITSLDRIIVDREETTRPSCFGKPVNCKEYWLEPSAIKMAEKLLFSKCKEMPKCLH